MTNGRQYVNHKFWKVTEIHLKYVYFGQSTTQLLSNFELWKSWKYKELWGLELYKELYNRVVGFELGTWYWTNVAFDHARFPVNFMVHPKVWENKSPLKMMKMILISP